MSPSTRESVSAGLRDIARLVLTAADRYGDPELIKAAVLIKQAAEMIQGDSTDE